jgi:hypothetical protein
MAMNVTQKIEADIWADDRLGFAEIGQSFTNIIQTIDDSKVISIEAPFGYGKTFFRERWSKQLQAAGELVIEIDALQSDHSGDPLVTFVGALLSAQPRSGEPIKQSTKEKLQKWGGILGRATLKAVLREGAEEVINAGAEWAKGETLDLDGIDQAIDALKNGLSSAAAQMIATHLAAEEARKIELPAQIDALRDALTEGSENKRIVIIVDELDRCHPEYAISLLEAMKLVFGREGFVFVLMVNPNYLEDVAKHRFGFKAEDELYLDKFIDIRLRLKVGQPFLAQLVKDHINGIHLEEPYGAEVTFGVNAAADLACQIVEKFPSSVRQVKRVLARIELVCRCYRSLPIDMPLLTALAFADLFPDIKKWGPSILPRMSLSPDYAEKEREELRNTEHNLKRLKTLRIDEKFRERFDELYSLPEYQYLYPSGFTGNPPSDWRKIAIGLAPHYIPSHQAMLDGVMRLQAD